VEGKQQREGLDDRSETRAHAGLLLVEPRREGSQRQRARVRVEMTRVPRKAGNGIVDAAPGQADCVIRRRRQAARRGGFMVPALRAEADGTVTFAEYVRGDSSGRAPAVTETCASAPA
jgi:hypothetical protein